MPPVEILLRDVPSSALVAEAPSTWEAWLDLLSSSQVLAEPVTPEDVTAWLEAMQYPPGAPLTLKRSMFPESLIIERLTRERRLSQGLLVELSALGTVAHQQAWTGAALLCNWAPTPFVLDGQRYATVDSFYHALKLPEGSAARQHCALAEPHSAKQAARRIRARVFSYMGTSITVGSAEHRSLFARALCAKLEQNLNVEAALKATCWSKLELPLTFTPEANVPGLITALVFMIERLKRWGPLEAPNNALQRTRYARR